MYVDRVVLSAEKQWTYIQVQWSIDMDVQGMLVAMKIDTWIKLTKTTLDNSYTSSVKISIGDVYDLI